jgi:hypothetical protein
MNELNYHIEMLVDQLHDAYITNADSACYVSVRDQLLSQREQVDTCVATLRAVITVTCPKIAAKERYSDPIWEEVFGLAKTIDSGSEENESSMLGKQKRTCNKTNCIYKLAIVSAL